eukprot:751202-Hanusia_phi.AAC.1
MQHFPAPGSESGDQMGERPVEIVDKFSYDCEDKIERRIIQIRDTTHDVSTSLGKPQGNLSGDAMKKIFRRSQFKQLIATIPLSYLCEVPRPVPAVS